MRDHYNLGHQLRGRIGFRSTGTEPAGRRSARAGLRPGGHSRCPAATQRHVKYCESAYGVAEGVDALVVATGWPEFRTLDFAKIRHLVKRPIIIDTKNLLDSSRLRAMGFQYMGVGRP